MRKTFRWTLTGVAAATLIAACSKPADPPTAVPAVTAAPDDGHAADAIAWRHVASDAEVDAAFALARTEGKPLFVYWGAAWCPPCNQLKATLFNRADFIQRSRAFVPVYIDGDSPGAQKLGSRFKVRGYPTTVLFDAQGTELTRLPGEVDAERYNELLTLGMNAQRPVKAVLAQARAGGQGLGADDWRLLAYYSWETDRQQLLDAKDLPALLQQLAQACPPAQSDSATRLKLKALAAAGDAGEARPDAAARAMVLTLLADPPRARAHVDLLTNNAAELLWALSGRGTPERTALAAAFDTALQRLQADETLSRADRVMALIGRVGVARVEQPKPAPEQALTPAGLPEALLADVRDLSARFDRDIRDGYERQAVITTAAYALEQAGLLAESDALLQANLAKSHSPYYLMADLASNAQKRGDTAGALRWWAQAFDGAQGAATRLQWGAWYLEALVKHTPADVARIEQVAAQLFKEAGAMPDAFYERSGRSLQRVAKQLLDWRQTTAHRPAFDRLRQQLDAVCRALPAGEAQRPACEALLRPATPATT